MRELKTVLTGKWGVRLTTAPCDDLSGSSSPEHIAVRLIRTDIVKARVERASFLIAKMSGPRNDPIYTHVGVTWTHRDSELKMIADIFEGFLVKWLSYAAEMGMPFSVDRDVKEWVRDYLAEDLTNADFPQQANRVMQIMNTLKEVR